MTQQSKNGHRPFPAFGDTDHPLEDKAIKDQLLIKDRAIAASVQGIGIGDLEGNIIYVNNAALRMWGTDDPSEVLGRSSLELAQDENQALEIMTAVLENGSWEGEIAGYRKDGSPIIVYLSASLVYNDEGEPVCTMDSFIDITERKKIEEELRIKDFAIASCIHGIGMADLEGTIIYVNQATLQIWGTSDPNELVGRSALDLARSRNQAETVLNTVLESGSWEGEIEGFRSDGTSITVLLSATLVFNDENQPVCIMVSFIDITERKRIEEELRIKDFAIASSIQGIGLGDLEGNVVYVNNAALRMWGADDPAEVIGRSSLEFAQDEAEALEVMTAVLENGSWEGEIAGFRKDGSPIIVYLSASLVYNDEGEPVCTMDSFIDITESKKIEEELRIKDFAVTSSINAIVIGDLQGNITYVNQAFLDMWGDHNVAEVLGRSAVSFARNPAKAEHVMAVILQDGRWYGEIEGVKKDGKPVTVLLSANLVTDTHGTPVCMMGAFVDITDRKNAETALAEANEELEFRVAERTRELVAANERLLEEIEERKKIETSLRETEEELRNQSLNLQETNTALKILLRQREQDKEDLEEKVMANVKSLILPYIEKLKNTPISSSQQTYLEILENNAQDMVSPYMKKLSTQYRQLTPMQIQVADLVKAGKTTKQMSELLNISDRAIEFHRNNIRNKLGLKNKKMNLRSYLLSLSP
jgi:PAS domain S-box-containing protein